MGFAASWRSFHSSAVQMPGVGGHVTEAGRATSGAIAKKGRTFGRKLSFGSVGLAVFRTPAGPDVQPESAGPGPAPALGPVPPGEAGASPPLVGRIPRFAPESHPERADRAPRRWYIACKTGLA